MSKAYGLIEVSGVVAAVDALDIMCKTADVTLSTWERRLGGRLVTIIVEGNVSACNEAVEAALERCLKKPVSWGVIPNPHEEIKEMVEFSSIRWKKKWADAQAKIRQEPEDEHTASYLYTV
ncbi:MAG: BMC domain-containing protein [Lachnospiraceae bacterium]|nr:BMC domain-containing protein [Lachnospiraceae bacterium]